MNCIYTLRITEIIFLSNLAVTIVKHFCYSAVNRFLLYNFIMNGFELTLLLKEDFKLLNIWDEINGNTAKYKLKQHDLIKISKVFEN